MRIRDFRKEKGLTLAQAAAALCISGANPSRTLQRIELGESRWDAQMVERIIEWSGGMVTLQDLHETRLEFLNSTQTPEVAE